MALANTAVIPAGQSSVKVKVRPTDDGSQRGPRTFTLKLAAPAAVTDYLIGAGKKATVLIQDRD